MLKRVKHCIEDMMKSEETFEEYYIRYIKKMQDHNIDLEVKNQLRFSLLQLSNIDRQIDLDYRKLVNESAKFT